MAVNYSDALKYAIFSQEVYRDFSGVTFTGITEPPVLIVQPKTDTQCAILPEGDLSTIVFRGSESSVDWNCWPRAIIDLTRYLDTPSHSDEEPRVVAA